MLTGALSAPNMIPTQTDIENRDMKSHSTPAIAECRWFWRDSARHEWVQDGESVECRASIGEKVVTVWLPGGAVIKKRRPPRAASLYEGRFAYGYGLDSDKAVPEKLIRFTLKPSDTP